MRKAVCLIILSLFLLSGITLAAQFTDKLAIGKKEVVNGILDVDGHVYATGYHGDGSALTGMAKAQVGLSNVDNTSDLNKPISTATQTALDLKATVSSLAAHTGNTSNPHSVTKTQVGLSNADNTSDANKPVSTATQTALNLKENTLTKGNISASTGISVSGGTGAVIGAGATITNTAPDQTVVLTAGTGIGVAGTYPSFTISNTAVITETDPVWGVDKALYQTASQADAKYLQSVNWALGTTSNMSGINWDSFYPMTNPSGFISTWTEADPVWSSDKSDYYTATQIDQALYIQTELDPVYSAWDKDYADIINTPDLSVYLTDAPSDGNEYVRKNANWSTIAGFTGVVADAPLAGTGTSASHLSIPQATASVDGYLYQQDWSTFNGKQANLSLVAGTYVDGKACTYTSSGTVLNCNTTYLTSYTETDPKVGTLTSYKIPKWLNTTLVDSMIYDSGTNLGIGTVAPVATLQISPTLDASYYGTGGDTISDVTINGVVWRVHKFTTTGASTFVAPSRGATLKVLVVAGGGGGGSGTITGGGGAGGYLYNASYTATASQSIALSVGGGGNAGQNGTNSVFGTMTAVGGGKGSYGAGSAGGSGGGAGYNNSSPGTGEAGPPRQGYDGGRGDTPTQYCTGGGGGSSSVGLNGTGTGLKSVGGAGGNGTLNTITGSSVLYASGGGGGGKNEADGASMLGGAGGNGNNGGNSTGSIPATAGMANRGDGGGGGGYPNGVNGAGGGSGVVIVSYVADTSSIIAEAITNGRLGVGNVHPPNMTDVAGAMSIGYGSSGTTVSPSNGLLVSGQVGMGVVTSPTGLLHLGTNTTATGIATNEQASADVDSFDLTFNKTRGTIASPTVITAADELGTIKFQGYSGVGGYITGAEIKSISEGTIATTRVPASLSFWTGTDAAPTVSTQRLKIDSAGLWTLFDGTTINTGATTGTKIGTATTQKIGFFNSAPVVQQTNTTEIGVALSNLGLRAAGTAYPITTSGSVTLGSLTSGRVPYASTAGLLVDSANLTFNGTTLQVGGTTNYITQSATGQVYVGTARPRRSFYVNASGMVPSTTSGSGAITRAETSTNKLNYFSSAFSGTATNYIEFTTLLPKSWDGGTVTAIFYYIPTGTNGGTGIIWDIQGVLIGDNVDIDSAWGSAVATADTIQTANRVHSSPESTAITIAGTLSGDKFIQWRIYRDGATDTNTDAANLLGVLIKYTATTETDN